MKKVKIDESRLGDFQYWEELFKTKEENFKKLKKQTKGDLLRDAYSKAPDHIRLNREWVLKGLTDFYFYVFSIDNQLKDKEFCLEYIETNRHPSLFGIPQEYQEELFEKIVLKNPWVIRDLFYEKHLINLKTKENYIKWIKLNPEIYKELGKLNSLKNDFTLAEVAVQTDFRMLFKMTKSIARKIVSRNLDLALEYMEKNIEVFTLLPLKTRNNKDFILKHAKRLNYECMPFVGSAALEHKEVVLSLKSFYQVKLPEKFLKDRDIALHIIKHSLHIHSYFKDCENFTLVELIKEILLETKAISFYNGLTESQKRTPEVIAAFLEINFFKEARPVTKQYNLSAWNARNIDYTTTEYFDTSVVKLLPEDVKEELIKEYKKTIEEDREPEELELLKFAKGKYLQLVLINKMDEKTKSKKLKI